MRRILAPLVFLALAGGCGTAVQRPAESHAAPPTPEAAAQFAELSDQYLSWYFARHPVRATNLGIHDHDSELPDLSRPGIERRGGELRAWLARLERIDPHDLDTEAYFDYRVLDHAMRAELLELEEIQGWRRNPMLYNRVISDGVASLVEREFDSLEQRLPDLIDRLDALPAVLVAAQRNLDDVPRLWAELGVRSVYGTMMLLEEDVEPLLLSQGLASADPRLRRSWHQSRRRAVARLERFADWLETDLSPAADGDFRLGRDLFERKLLYEEHLSLSVVELRRMNERAIQDYRRWVAVEAARVDASRTPDEVMARITTDHPTPLELIPEARKSVQRARSFVEQRKIVTLPVESLPLIRPAPDFARAGFASMSTPGPFETVARQAYYNITNVDPAWSREQQAQHLTYFNYPGLLGISIHEVMPGHFVQLMARKQLPTAVRKVFLPASVVEGWAHYAEQMMIDEGLGENDPTVRLAQLRRALQRHARWEAGLSMHAFDASLDAAVRRFQEIAYFARFPAVRETQRGTYNPTYLYYALGRMEIFRLREDYRAYLEARGERFSLRDFHDRFLHLGLPIPLAREALMPGADAAGSRDSAYSYSGSTPRPVDRPS